MSEVRTPQPPSAPCLPPSPRLHLNFSLPLFITRLSPNSRSLEVGRGCARTQGRSSPAARGPASPGGTARYVPPPFIHPTFTRTPGPYNCSGPWLGAWHSPKVPRGGGEIPGGEAREGKDLGWLVGWEEGKAEDLVRSHILEG